MRNRTSRLTEWARERVGDGLRATGYHTADDYEVLYLRDDLEDVYAPERGDTIIETVRALNDQSREFADSLSVPQEGLYVFEEYLIVQFPVDEGAVFMSLDHDVGRSFVSFISECRGEMLAVE